jgi:hypothetical protein
MSSNLVHPVPQNVKSEPRSDESIGEEYQSIKEPFSELVSKENTDFQW